MKISNKKLAEAKVQKARRDLLKARKDLKEALICGPTGSFTKSTAHSTKIMGYTGLQEDEDFDADFDEDELDFADTKTAIDIAFPEANPTVKKIIERWYDAEGTCEDFTDNSEFADYMKNDIEAMLDAADYPERGIVAKELVAKGYVEDDLWSMEESTKKPLTESENASDVKSFDEVQVGDIGKDYADIKMGIKGGTKLLNSAYKIVTPTTDVPASQITSIAIGDTSARSPTCNAADLTGVAVGDFVIFYGTTSDTQQVFFVGGKVTGTYQTYVRMEACVCISDTYSGTYPS